MACQSQVSYLPSLQPLCYRAHGTFPLQCEHPHPRPQQLGKLQAQKRASLSFKHSTIPGLTLRCGDPGTWATKTWCLCEETPIRGRRPVRGMKPGVLAAWGLSGLSGLYHVDQRIQTLGPTPTPAHSGNCALPGHSYAILLLFQKGGWSRMTNTTWPTSLRHFLAGPTEEIY